MKDAVERSYLAPWRTALLCAALYLLVGSVWIVASDRFVRLLAGNDGSWLTSLQSFKGTAFVLVTSGMVFGLVYASLRVRARATEAVRRRGRQLEILSHTSQQINSVLEVPVILRRLVDAARDVTGARNGTAGMLINGEMVFTEYLAGSEQLAIDYRFPPGFGVPGHVIQTRQPYVSADAEHDPHVVQEVRKALGFTTLADVPIINRRGELLGCFELHNKQDGGPFNEDDLVMLQGLAASAAVALDNAHYLADLEAAESALKRAKDTAEAANTAKDRFLAVLSHELRTPLTPVLATLTALEKDPAAGPSPDDLRTLRRNVELEARLIDDLLDLTRITHGKLRLSPETVDAGLLLRNAVDICRSDIQDKELSLEVEVACGLAYVRGDPGRLLQVFWNLIKNAVKFTPHGGQVAVRCTRREDRVAITVRDSGVGISPEVLPQIFDAFHQGSRGTTQQFGGLGLGLAISKALVDLHGGALQAASAGRDQGATFTVELPLVAAPAAPAAPASPARPAAEPATVHILLVEDHPDTARVFSRLLRGLGYKVTSAEGVQSALQKIGREHFDVLISDIGLPDGSGLELMRAVREREPIAGIAVSGFGMDEDVRKSQEAGFMEHLTKPLSIQRLQAAIELALQQSVFPQPPLSAQSFGPGSGGEGRR